MALKRMVLEIGMGTDIRGADYTKAAVRALRDALWHNSLSVADALGQSSGLHAGRGDRSACRIPSRSTRPQVLAVLPHGTGTVKVVEGGLEIANDAGTDSTLIAHAAAVVRLDVAKGSETMARKTRHPRNGHRQRPARRRLHQGGAARGAGRAASQLARHDPLARSRFEDACRSR